MKKSVIDDNDDFEWDRTRLIAVFIIIMIGIAGVWTVARFYQPSTYVQNVMYNSEVDNDPDRFNTLLETYFGGDPNFDNVSLVIVNLMIAQIPDVNRLGISISTTSIHLTAIILAPFEDETNVLHGMSNIPAEQDSYALTVDGVNMNLILYLFFINVSSGSYSLNIRSYIAG